MVIELDTGEEVQIIQIAMDMVRRHIFRNPTDNSAHDVRMCNAAQSITDQVQDKLAEQLGAFIDATNIYLRSTRFDTKTCILDTENALTSPGVDTVEKYIELHFPDAKEVYNNRWPDGARYFRVNDVHDIEYTRAVWFA